MRACIGHGRGPRPRRVRRADVRRVDPV